MTNEWQPIETAPTDGRGIRVKLSNGSECYAEYWDGPPDKPEWGGWGVQMTRSFVEGRLREDCDADMVSWMPLDPPPSVE